MNREIFFKANGDLQGQQAVQALSRVVELLLSSKRQQFFTTFCPEHNASEVHQTFNTLLISVECARNFDVYTEQSSIALEYLHAVREWSLTLHIHSLIRYWLILPSHDTTPRHRARRKTKQISATNRLSGNERDV